MMPDPELTRLEALPPLTGPNAYLMPYRELAIALAGGAAPRLEVDDALRLVARVQGDRRAGGHVRRRPK